VFVVLDEDEKQAAAAATAAPQGAPSPAPAAGQAPEFVPVPDATLMHPGPAPAAELAYVDDLRAAVEASGKPAYGQFRKLFEALPVPDETQRTQLALAAAGASAQVTAADVVAAIDDRLKLLEKERGAFDQAIAQQTDASIGAVKKQIVSIAEQIAKKQAEIRDLEQRRATAESSIAQAAAEIEASRRNFAASFAVVQTDLAGERARVAAHVPPSTTR
ncbi:MAG TPA: hypothetical protein VFH27_12795, partial [Longimicrobiaceae bacterium]|nr:hypothetical protein [Longimicrobiaceae bacterium]